jgi:SAM-dependent methyltransferase
MQYLFGDTDIAAQRLKVLAEVFAESTSTFLRDSAIDRLHLAVDLGCGPGLSTRLLAETLRCDRTVGLDNSRHFIRLAQQTQTERGAFYFHDVTSVPFPVGPSDILYCRFLLTHLKEPHEMIKRWATQVHLEGLLLMEEVEWIDTKHPVFGTYLEIVEAMLGHQSNRLYVGPALNTLQNIDVLKLWMNTVRHLPVATDRAAAMFFLNMQTWKDHPFIQKNYSATLIKELEDNLNTLTQKAPSTSEIEWGIRQSAFKRV